MATLRGSDGEITLAGATLGEMQGWELEVSREAIETTKSKDAAKSYTLDIPGASGRMRCNLDYDDAQQASLIDMLVAGTVPSALAAIFLHASGKTFVASILPTSGRIASQLGPSVATVEFPFIVTDAITITWA